jgi:hypothetical protein
MIFMTGKELSRGSIKGQDDQEMDKVGITKNK